MSETRKSLVDSLRELDALPVDEVHDAAADDVTKLSNALTIDEKKQQAYDWMMQGHDVKGIAKIFERSPRTIFRWFQDLYAEHRERMEQVPGADHIAEHLMWLGKLEQLCLHEINSTSDNAVVDPKTGEVTKVQDNRTKTERVKWMQAALQARRVKIDILQRANILPVEPEKIYHTMSDERREVEEEASVTKSREEIEDAIKKLISKGLSL